MAILTIQNFDDHLNQRLQIVANRHGHSIEEEVRDILEKTLAKIANEMQKKEVPAGKKLSARFRNIGSELALPTRALPRDVA
jgi:plasmid stability protein